METNIARILLNHRDADNKQDNILLQGYQFDPAVMVDMFPGPALLVDQDMNVVHHNVFSNGLLQPILNQEAALKSMVSRCLSNMCPDTRKAALKDDMGLRHYDLYTLPITQKSPDQKPLVFLFGKETTIEHNLTNALVESRQMFKDLVSCSTDFAWETDCNGNFIYVSPMGILGYTSFELNGKNSRDMIVGAEEKNPFDTMDKVTDMELWLKRVDGTMACLLVSAVPVLDSQATWKGARGVCRDITSVRERESILRRTHKREHVLNRIIATIRDMDSPAAMMENALDAITEGIGADYCCITQKNTLSNGSFKAEIKQQQGTLNDPDMLDNLRQIAVEAWQNPDIKSNHNSGRTQISRIGEHRILAGITSHHAQDNGVIFLIRNNNMEWTEDETHLFNGITAHLGIAIEQANTHKELEKRAFTDELTNLLNRRAFKMEVTKRISHQQRSGKKGAMLCIDLDNFKNVNDSKGHARGDEVLIEVSSIINKTIRAGDYSARIGGDEFAIWLDGISEEDALIKARHLVSMGSELARIADVSGAQPSLSVGVAINHPEHPQTFDEIIAQADEALYEAKNNGKANCVLYDSETAQKRTEEQSSLNEGI